MVEERAGLWVGVQAGDEFGLSGALRVGVQAGDEFGLSRASCF